MRGMDESLDREARLKPARPEPAESEFHGLMVINKLCEQAPSGRGPSSLPQAGSESRERGYRGASLPNCKAVASYRTPNIFSLWSAGACPSFSPRERRSRAQPIRLRCPRRCRRDACATAFAPCAGHSLAPRCERRTVLSRGQVKLLMTISPWLTGGAPAKARRGGIGREAVEVARASSP